MKKLLTCVLLAVFIFGLFSCSETSDGSITAIAENKRYGTTTMSEMTYSEFEAMYSFYDNDYYYYVFYLGMIDHVPLQNTAPTYQYSGTPFTKEVTCTSTNSSTVSKMVSNASSKCVNMSFNSNVKGKLGVIEAGLSASISHSEQTSATQSYTEAETYSKTVQDKTVFSFNKDSAHGYYRYILLGDVNVFGVAAKKISDGSFEYFTYEVVASQYYSLDYSPTSTFGDNNYGSLDFDVSESYLNSLPIPTVNVADSETVTPPVLKDPSNLKYRYENKSSKEIDATYKYSDIDVFDLAEDPDFRPYMTDKYTFTFKITIQMEEKWDGFQEIYIFNSEGVEVAGISDYQCPDGETVTETWTWKVSGENVTDVMNMVYGAHGQWSDDWVRIYCIAEVTVNEKQ